MPQYVGSVYLDVRFDATQASRNLQTSMGAAGAAGGAAATQAASNSLLQFGTQATRIGRQLSFGLAAPLALFGKASEQAFVEFDTNMTKVAALTGVGATQTAEWTDEVLSLATSYGVAGEDAANALYLITSSGIKGQAAINTLGVALKASAVGMGDAKTMAGLLTSAMNAYGANVLPAAKAADILTGAVQESKIPADELAGSLSQLLPFGSKLGISFEQITGAMAALSLQGTGSAQAATQLRGIFNSMLDPSSSAAKALGRVHLSAEQLRKTFATGGIVPGLRQLQQAIVASGGEADSELANIFGNVRALTGVFQLLNGDTEQIDRIFKNTAESAGKLNAAYIITANTAGFKAKQANVEMHNSMIELGRDVAPVATTFLHMASAVVNFVDAVGPLKYALIGLGTGLAILGPAAYSIGAIADVFGIASGFAQKFGADAVVANTETATSAQGAAVAEGEVAAAAGAAAAAETELAATAGVATAEVTQGALFSAETMGTLVVATEAETEAMGQLALFGPTAMSGIEVQAGVAAAEMGTLATATEGVAVAEGTATAAAAPMGAAMMAALGPVAVALAGIVGAYAIWQKRMEIAQQDADGLGDVFANKVAKGGVDEANKTIGKTTDQIKQLRAEADDVKAPWDLDYKAELYKGADALEAHVKATKEDIALARELSGTTGESADKLFQWVSSQRNAGITYKTSKEALAAYTKSMGEHGEVVSEAATETGKLEEKARDLADKFFGVQKAQFAYRDAVQGVADAQRKAADAQVAITDARRAETDAIAKVADAQDRHRESLHKVADAQRSLTEASATYQELLKGPTKGESLDVRSAQLALQRAQANLRKPTKDPLDRQQNQLDVERAQMALEEARGAHSKNLAKAQDDVTRAQDNLTTAQKDAVNAAKAIGDAQRDVETAHRHVKDAQDQAVAATQAVEKAQFDALVAADNMATAQGNFATAIANSNAGLGPLVDYLGTLKGLYPEVDKAMQPTFDKLNALNEWAKAPPSPPEAPLPEQSNQERLAAYIEWLKAGRPGGEWPPKRAMGGPLAAGQLSTVNELGAPEMWTQGGKQYLLPAVAGHVTPLQASVDASVTNQPSLNVSEINVYGADAPVQTAYEIRRQLRSKRDLVGRR